MSHWTHWHDDYDVGFAEVDHVELAGSASTVGAHRLTTPQQRFEPSRRMFSFVDAAPTGHGMLRS